MSDSQEKTKEFDKDLEIEYYEYERPEPDVNDIINRIWSPSQQEIEDIKKAYKMAQDAHAGQTRYSGEPYFNHVFVTAQILADLGMDVKSIIAGLLHDTIEDADLNPEIIKNTFDEDVLFLVQGVTKLGHVRYQGMKRHIESLRKLFVATSQDIRVLIIKLADRLHNMRTLQFVPERKQERIATETMEVYAPIAHRLGIGRVKGQLQDLAFPFICPEDYMKIKRLSDEKYEEGVKNLKQIHKKLKVALQEENIHDVEVDFRLKHLYSLYQKLKRKNKGVDNIDDMDIDQIYDIVALRVIVSSVTDCYRVLGIVHGMWRPLPGRIKDYISFPKPNGYKSLHTTIFTGEGGIAEIQIRTRKMHREAEFGIASHVNYKEGSGSDAQEAPGNIEWFQRLMSSVGWGDNGDQPEPVSENRMSKDVPSWIKEMATIQEEAQDDEFMNNLKTDFFEDRIFVFTPNGDVIDLPADSSPVDFAYQIHSDIGDHISGARVNNKLVSLDTSLENGDIVEIETSDSNEPKRKWLDYTKTTLAKKRIRSALRKQSEGEN